jgi:hypothetical protein
MKTNNIAAEQVASVMSRIVASNGFDRARGAGITRDGALAGSSASRAAGFIARRPGLKA